MYGPVRGPTLGLTIESVAQFAAGGLASELFGCVLQYEGTRRVGASRTSPIVASTDLVSAVLAVVVLEESVTVSHLPGIVLVVGGVAATSWETASDAPEESLRETGAALTFPLVSVMSCGVEPLFVKLGLRSGTPATDGLAVTPRHLERVTRRLGLAAAVSVLGASIVSLAAA